MAEPLRRQLRDERRGCKKVAGLVRHVSDWKPRLKGDALLVAAGSHDETVGQPTELCNRVAGERPVPEWCLLC